LRWNQSQRLVLDSHGLVEINCFGYEVGVERVEVVIEQGREVLGQVIGLLQTRPKTVSECSDIWHVVVLTDDVRLLFHIVFKLSLPVCV